MINEIIFGIAMIVLYLFGVGGFVILILRASEEKPRFIRCVCVGSAILMLFLTIIIMEYLSFALNIGI